MKRYQFHILMLVLLLGIPAGMAHAQVGTLRGTIVAGDPSAPDSVTGATVRVDLFMMNGLGYHAEAVSGERGAFILSGLPVGTYQVQASMPSLGFASDVVDVLPNGTSWVYLVLMGGEGSDGYLPMVAMWGTVDVVDDPLSDFNHIFLDADNNGDLDYRLVFGPPWYEPPDPLAQRPEDGQQLLIGGTLFGYSDPPLIVVIFMDRFVWRDPSDPSHGGWGGEFYDSMGCDRLLERIELTGTVDIIDRNGIPTYALRRAGGDTLYLDFGNTSYAPPNNAIRPESGDTIHIVGGLTLCSASDLPRVLVYELDGQFWREPGDARGLELPMGAAPDPRFVPQDFLTADNYPNPFNARTTIRFTLQHAGRATVRVYDLEGREVAQLMEEVLAAGSYTVPWDGTGSASGIYFYAVEQGAARVVRRMVLLK